VESVLLCGDARELLPQIPDRCVQCVVTSPPYWGIRDYNVEGQIGAEGTLEKYVEEVASVFREINRIIKDNGCVWLNLGDGYTSGNRKYRATDKKYSDRAMSMRPDTPIGLKDKDLLGVPWRVAFRLQADGWFVRGEHIWYKRNCMPESVKDRPMRAHEHVFLLSKNERYYFDNRPFVQSSIRSVWDIPTARDGSVSVPPFPEELVRLCVESGSREGDLVVDPFFGSGVVGRYCEKVGRRYIGIDINGGILRHYARANGKDCPEPIRADDPELKEWITQICTSKG